MIFECSVNTNLEINSLMDLHKLKPFIDNGMKVNYSRLARELDVDRRTIKKYCLGFTKKQKDLDIEVTSKVKLFSSWNNITHIHEWIKI